MKLIYCLMILLCPLISFSQGAKKLKVGDIVPDICFNTDNLYSYKKKIIILDFWAGYCSACFHKFPLLDSLVLSHPNDLSVLLISNSLKDNAANTKHLFGRIINSNEQKLSLPLIFGDTVANSMFSVNSLPHYVWLDSSFKIIAITGMEEVSYQNIAAALKGQYVKFVHKDGMDEFDYTIPLFHKGNGGDEMAVIARSTLTYSIPGLRTKSFTNLDSVGKVTKIVMTNMPLIQMIMKAYRFYDKQEYFHFPYLDSLQTITHLDEEWIKRKSYTYELITPPVNKFQAFLYLQEDLKRFFGIAARIDTIPADCYVLEVENSDQFSNRSDPKQNIQMDDDGNWNYNDCTIHDLADGLDALLTLHVFNEVSIKGYINIRLPDSKDPELLNRSLFKYGLKLFKVKRNLPNLFIYKLPN